MKKLFFVLGAIALMCAACKSDEQKLEEKVESYLSQMTLEEKTGIIHAHSPSSTPPATNGLPKTVTSISSSAPLPMTSGPGPG